MIINDSTYRLEVPLTPTGPNADLIRELAGVEPGSLWGGHPTMPTTAPDGSVVVPGVMVFTFNPHKLDDVLQALSDHDEVLLEREKKFVCERINLLRDQKIEGGFTFQHDEETYPIQSAASDRENILGLGVVAGNAIAQGSPEGDLRWLDPNVDFGFIAADNRTIPLDARGMAALFARGISFKGSMTYYARAFKDQVLSLETLAEVRAVNHEDGWPE